MNKRYLKKIIANDDEGLRVISAHCYKAKVRIGEIKFLKKNKLFIIFLKRFLREVDKTEQLTPSVCKFEFVDKVKSKNINQNEKDLELELLTIDVLKYNNSYEINLFFSNNANITLTTEIIEATLEDQNENKNN